MIRANAVRILGRKGTQTAIPKLIELLDDRVEEVRSACVTALEGLTGKSGFGDDPLRWKKWWEEEGLHAFPRLLGDREDLRKMVEEQFKPQIQAGKDALDDRKREIRITLFYIIMVGFVFLLVMIYFVGHISSRLREWKEVVKQADLNLKENREIAQRTDKVIEELEAKKQEILDYFKRQRDETQAEMDRYSGHLEENADHRMREEVMALRQKAEKELEQTVGELKAQMEAEVRRIVSDYRDRLVK